MKWILLEDIIMLIVLLISVVFYIVFTGLRYSYLSSNALALELKRDQKRKAGSSLGRLIDNPDRFWHTLLFATNVLLIFITLNVIIISKKLLKFFPDVVANYFRNYDYMLSIAGIVFTIILISISDRWFAKTIFEYKPENKINFWSKTVMLLSNFLNPIVLSFRKMADFILVYLFNARINKKDPVFRGINPNNFFRQSIQGHTILDQLNKEFFQGAVSLTQVNVRRCVTPRTEISAVDINQSIEELREKFVSSKLSKMIIYDKHLDNIVGYVHHLDLNTAPKNIKDILIPLPAVPEAMSALDVIKMFTKDRKSIALVADEFGGTTGVVTMDDILEEIFGNIKDEYDYEELVEKQISESEYILSGRLKLDYLNDKYDFKFPEDVAETLSGYIIARHESIPKLKQKIIIGRYEFEILLVTNTKIESVRMKVFYQ